VHILVRVHLVSFAVAGVMVASAAAQSAATSAASAQAPERKPDVIWIPTEDAVVTAMLKLANVRKTDVVYDLGCGDGRIVIAAARQFGARGVGVDIDPERITEANAAAARAGVTDKVKFVVGDIFDPNLKISDATVVALFLLQSMNERLRPRLQAELRPGSRIVANSFTLGDSWPADKNLTVGNSVIYLWTVR
jgi:SAM-dependent methyltransferase